MRTDEKNLNAYNYISLFEKYATNTKTLEYFLNFLNVQDITTIVDKIKSEIALYERLKKINSSAVSNLKNLNKIIAKDKHGVQIIDINDIYYLRASGSYTEFFIKGQESLITSKCLKEYQNLLPNNTFFRSHQSYIINLNYLIRYDKREGDFLVLKNGYKVPLASRKKDSFLKLYL